MVAAVAAAVVVVAVVAAAASERTIFKFRILFSSLRSKFKVKKNQDWAENELSSKGAGARCKGEADKD